MNVCFAICITLLIYQNTQLKDEIETVKNFSQLDVDKTFDRLDAIEEYQALVKITIKDIYKNINQIGTLYNERMEDEDQMDTKQNEIIKILDTNQKTIAETVTNIEDFLLEYTKK